MIEYMKCFWRWFYAELPAYYSIPIIGLVFALFVAKVLNG